MSPNSLSIKYYGNHGKAKNRNERLWIASKQVHKGRHGHTQDIWTGPRIADKQKLFLCAS